jgi:hypothetical protein
LSNRPDSCHLRFNTSDQQISQKIDLNHSSLHIASEIPPREIICATGVAPSVSIESSAKLAGIEKSFACSIGGGEETMVVGREE